ncbi:MAG TPA: hypothetical protein PL029_09550, partial [Bacteroidia bacterium]|nr:hypothetical protein [Bacteroidia bacterium]
MKKPLLFIASCFISGIISSQTVLQWEKVLNGSTENHGGSIKTNAAGEVFVAGVFTGTVDFDPGAPVYTLAAV